MKNQKYIATCHIYVVEKCASERFEDSVALLTGLSKRTLHDKGLLSQVCGIEASRSYVVYLVTWPSSLRIPRFVSLSALPGVVVYKGLLLAPDKHEVISWGIDFAALNVCMLADWVRALIVEEVCTLYDTSSSIFMQERVLLFITHDTYKTHRIASIEDYASLLLNLVGNNQQLRQQVYVFMDDVRSFAFRAVDALSYVLLRAADASRASTSTNEFAIINSSAPHVYDTTYVTPGIIGLSFVASHN